MDFDPQKFFIGLMDFFSILLPGALLTWLLMDGVGPVMLGPRYASLGGAQAWAVFLFVSYILGHLVFLLGSWLDELYDWLRRYTLNTQIKLIAHRACLLSWPARAMIWLVFKYERNLAVDRATRLKRRALGPLQAQDAVNTFQWSKALLNTESPASLALVLRFEADSKFFRCFAVVLLLLLIAWPWHQQWPPGAIPLVLAMLVLALWRFMEQRYKATNQAYWSVITLTARDGKVALDTAPGGAGGPSHAGGVVLRMRHGVAECLLVEASDDPAQWVLPKGHIEAGERHRETAVREVYEETGIWARIDGDLGHAVWTVDGAAVTTHFFLMRAVGSGLQQHKNRRHQWLTLPQASATASHSETRDLLRAAQRHLSNACPA